MAPSGTMTAEELFALNIRDKRNVSPGDRAGEILERVADLLNAGAALVWVVDTARRRVRVSRADGSAETVNAAGTLLGDDVLPGFSLPVSEIV